MRDSIFCERLPDVAARARKTGRLEKVLPEANSKRFCRLCGEMARPLLARPPSGLQTASILARSRSKLALP